MLPLPRRERGGGPQCPLPPLPPGRLILPHQRLCRNCHCEGVERPKQSHQASREKEIAALPSVARNDKKGITTQSLKGEEIRLRIFMVGRGPAGPWGIRSTRCHLYDTLLPLILFLCFTRVFLFLKPEIREGKNFPLTNIFCSCIVHAQIIFSLFWSGQNKDSFLI